MANVINEKPRRFALRIIKLYQFLINKKEYTLSKQILRSGTSIGVNVNESQSAESTADFIHKLNIALKETRETEYWLELLKDANYIKQNQYISINNDCTEIIKILKSIINTSKGKII
jgi:four helix bundle protein